MLRGLGAGALTLIVVAVILVVAAVPLVLVYRSECPAGDDPVTSYDIVAPWDDPPQRCEDHEQGYEIVLDGLGL